MLLLCFTFSIIYIFGYITNLSTGLFNCFAHSAGPIHLAVVDYLLSIIVCSDRTGQGKTGRRTGRDRTADRTRDRTDVRSHKSFLQKRDDTSANFRFKKHNANNIVRADPAQPAQPDGMHHICSSNTYEMLYVGSSPEHMHTK